MAINTHLKALSIGVVLTSLSMTSLAEGTQSKHALGTTLSPFGLGLFHTYKFNEQLQLRTSFHGIEDDETDVELSNIDYDGDIDNTAFGLVLDWYPLSKGWKRKLFFSGGVMYADNEYKGTATAKLGETINVGGASVGPGDIQSLDIEIESDKQVVPYIGIGWGNKIQKQRGFSFIGEVGLAYFDDPDVKLTANDPNGVLTQANLDAERKQILDDEFEDLSVFVSLGVSYHF